MLEQGKFSNQLIFINGDEYCEYHGSKEKVILLKRIYNPGAEHPRTLIQEII